MTSAPAPSPASRTSPSPSPVTSPRSTARPAPTPSLKPPPHSVPALPPAPAPTVSLVLGSGGARGLAHIGVIDWLLDQGYQIRAIAGSSMGALVGGIHAHQKLPVYTDWVCALERAHVLRLLDPALGRDGLFKGERIIGVLRDLLGDRHIEDLPLAYTAVATDLDTGEEVWLRQGRLFDAIRASMATPLVFTPFRLGLRTLMDGALVNPLPVEPTRTDRTDLTIAVNLSGPAEVLSGPPPAAAATAAGGAVAGEGAGVGAGVVAGIGSGTGAGAGTGTGAGRAQRIAQWVSQLRPARPANTGTRGMRDVAFQSMQVMHDTLTRLRLDADAPDISIDIPRNACGFFEFWRAQEMIDLGRERAARALASRPGWRRTG